MEDPNPDENVDEADQAEGAGEEVEVLGQEDDAIDLVDEEYEVYPENESPPPEEDQQDCEVSTNLTTMGIHTCLSSTSLAGLPGKYVHMFLTVRFVRFLPAFKRAANHGPPASPFSQVVEEEEEEEEVEVKEDVDEDGNDNATIPSAVELLQSGDQQPQNDEEPDAQATTFTGNTRAVMGYLQVMHKRKLDRQAESGHKTHDGIASFNKIVAGKKRLDTSRWFFEMLVLKSKVRPDTCAVCWASMQD